MNSYIESLKFWNSTGYVRKKCIFWQQYRVYKKKNVYFKRYSVCKRKSKLKNVPGCIEEFCEYILESDVVNFL